MLVDRDAYARPSPAAGNRLAKTDGRGGLADAGCAAVLLVGLLAFSTGANDNSKCVATLVGFGAARPTQALIYAAITTALGGCVSFFIAGGLLKAFSGGWLFDKSVQSQLNIHFYIAVL